MKSVSNKNNFFKRQSHESDSIILDEDDFNNSDDSESLYEIEKFLVKKTQIIQEKKNQISCKMIWLKIRTWLMI